MSRRREPVPLTDYELQELWRNEGAAAAIPLDASWCHKYAPDLVGPMLPPGQRWFARGRPKDAWQVAAEERHERERAEARLDERQMSLAL